MASSLFKSAWAMPVSGTRTANSINVRIMTRFISYPPFLPPLRWRIGRRGCFVFVLCAGLPWSRRIHEAARRTLTGGEMKLAVGILALLLVLAGLLAVPLIAHRAREWPDCISHVVIVRGRNGGPVECVCLDGTLSTCFDPGP
jgi:hypothetical protein